MVGESSLLAGEGSEGLAVCLAITSTDFRPVLPKSVGMAVGAKSLAVVGGGASYCTRGDAVGGGALALVVAVAVEEGRSCTRCLWSDVTFMPFVEGAMLVPASLWFN